MSCCAPRAPTGPATQGGRPGRCALPAPDPLVLIPGGLAQLGTDTPLIPEDDEGPMRAVPIRSFTLGATAVTNRQFARFVAESGHVTQAEHCGHGFVFRGHVQAEASEVSVADPAWWMRVEGADWRHPGGRRSDSAERPDHPVVQVAQTDAAAYCAWYGLRLPQEVEWEHAARGGLSNPTYPWGDQPPDETGFHPCNIWQGRFPHMDTGLDGHAGLAPAGSFAPNGYGLFNMCGNVWEWTASTKGADRVLKGGSHLCHPSYCHRYRIAARMAQSDAMTTSHIGFRVCGSE
ncbi:formylglycine-generating enzyme family protein [Falsirhodobacter halotolerans]|uniref:formylglycine-generating enzyme family protein n=1 Tax=Falsirhodobacter halotolerans TaxID=1146892 RepID=UPI001FD4EBBE|nr:formylglycine-generating enzyme family protein [Falsirhodobacter halotolerans]MCJ8139176.1 formylglycine-generating enzyme family protein [Falsirhodobacter halotolerans]